MGAEFTRRDFLKLGNIAVSSIIGAKAIGIVTPILESGKEIKPYEISTEAANFIGLFGAHGIQKGFINVPGQPVPKEIFEQGRVDALFPEGLLTVIDSTKENSWHLDNGKAKEWLNQLWYKEISQPFFEKKFSLILGDFPSGDTPLEYARTALTGAFFNALPTFVGIAGSLGAIAENFEGSMTRKEFLKRSAAGLVALWGATHPATEMARSISTAFRDLPWKDEIREITSFGEFLHFEDIILNFRNALIAEKLLYYAQAKKEKLGRKPNIAIMMGVYHSLLPEYLKRGREFCLNYLKIYPSWFSITQYGKKNINFYGSALTEVTPGNYFSKVNTFFDPKLQELFLDTKA